MSSEEWRSVAGYEGRYEISDSGKVRGLSRSVSTRGGAYRTIKGVLLKFDTRNGYPSVQLSPKGKSRTFYVHALVLTAFYGPRPPGQETRHLNGIRSDCALRNLKWGTSSENNFDIVLHGRHYSANKTACPYGHAYTPENVYNLPSGGRACLTCRKMLSDHKRYIRQNGCQI